MHNPKNLCRSVVNDRRFLNRPIATALIAFTWALIMGLQLQLIALPVLLPHLHAGDGLLRGGDSVLYHEAARNLARRIREHGWLVWELRPNEGSIVAIIAPLYVWTGIDAPWVVLPLNAMLFGMAVGELHRLVARVTSTSWAWIGVIPLIAFPSSALIYGQMLKEAYSILGLFLLFNAIMDIVKPDSRRPIVALSIRIGAGLGLIWFARPYLVEVALFSFWLGVGVFFIGKLVADRQWNMTQFAGMVTLAIVVQMAVVKVIDHVEPPAEQAKQVVMEVGMKAVTEDLMNLPKWLLHDRAVLLGQARANFISSHGDAGSLIDPFVEIRSVTDVIEYSPRALLVGLGAPFPSDWLTAGKGPGGDTMRKLAGLEMLIAYVAYVGLLVGAWVRWRSRGWAELVAVVVAAMAVVFVYVVAVPVVGALYRMRLAGWHACIGIGLVFLVQALSGVKLPKARAVGRRDDTRETR